MPDDPPPHPVSVSGGSDGIAADCAAMTHLAGRFSDVAGATTADALTLHAVTVDAALLSSAVLDPAGFAAFEAALAWALDGPQGLSWAALECGALAGELRSAAAAYGTADRLATDLHDTVAGLIAAPGALFGAATVLARTGDPLVAVEAVAAGDPALADVLVNALGVPGLLAATARGLPDGHGRVTNEGTDRLGGAATPPRGLTDLLTELAARDADGRSGSIDVRTVILADGSRRVIVDITGTKSWDPLPTSDVTSLTTNGRALVGERTAYEQGVLAAMRRAGVRPEDPVMLVGHSQGGMVAVTAARDAVRSGAFRVTHVVTAGSPIGRTAGEVPSGVQVLALENGRDVVPHLDGRANPDRPNVTTVTGRRGDGRIGADHSLDEAYIPIAGDAEASGDRSVRDFLTSADGYFHGVRVETHVYQISRSY